MPGDCNSHPAKLSVGLISRVEMVPETAATHNPESQGQARLEGLKWCHRWKSLTFCKAKASLISRLEWKQVTLVTHFLQSYKHNQQVWNSLRGSDDLQIAKPRVSLVDSFNKYQEQWQLTNYTAKGRLAYQTWRITNKQGKQWLTNCTARGEIWNGARE